MKKKCSEENRKHGLHQGRNCKGEEQWPCGWWPLPSSQCQLQAASCWALQGTAAMENRSQDQQDLPRCPASLPCPNHLLSPRHKSPQSFVAAI